MLATLFVYAMWLQESSANQWDLRSMWTSMGLLAKIVVVILFILSVYSFGVMIDRFLMYNNARKQSRLFVQQVAGALKDGKLDEAIAIAERNKKSHIAKVVATGLSEFQSASQQVSDEEVIEAAKRGLLLLTCGNYGNVIRIMVPLTITDEVLSEGLTILEAAIAATQPS